MQVPLSFSEHFRPAVRIRPKNNNRLLARSGFPGHPHRSAPTSPASSLTFPSPPSYHLPQPPSALVELSFDFSFPPSLALRSSLLPHPPPLSGRGKNLGLLFVCPAPFSDQFLVARDPTSVSHPRNGYLVVVAFSRLLIKQPSSCPRSPSNNVLFAKTTSTSESLKPPQPPLHASPRCSIPRLRLAYANLYRSHQRQRHAGWPSGDRCLV